MSNSRHLTTGEIAIARQVFGDSLNYEAVKIHDGAFVFFQPHHSGMTPNGEIYAHDCFKADFSQGDANDRAFFIHEMTHVWQYQNKVLNPITEAIKLNFKHKFNYAAAYEFQLDDKKDLTDYNMEQQASIVAEYFQVKEAKGNVSQHEKVLKNFLANSSYARKPGL